MPARAVGGGQKAGHVQAGDAPAAKPVSTLADPSTARAIFHNAMEYAVELGQLDHNPVKKIKWKAPKVSSGIDRRRF